MMISLVADGLVNGLDTRPDSGGAPSPWAGDHVKEDMWRLRHTQEGMAAPLTLRIGHRGRVRLSELRRQLKTGRDRDPTGICLARRHLLTDLAVALTATDKDAPLSVVFIDMNGLKAINDAHGHHAGDEAIRAYLEAVVATFGEHGEAYRGEGGDEAVVILPKADDGRAGNLLGVFVRQLGKDVVSLGGVEHRLTASCGSASTVDPGADAQALHDRADATMYRAKIESKKHDPRVSAHAVGEGSVSTYPPGAGVPVG
jgi:diguanylate cyclase (GGDEF)-like protein